MNAGAWQHHFISANGIRHHYVRHGGGPALFLLHGWPEFWYTWHKNILPLAQHFDVIVPDLRGFGDTEKPALPDPPSSLLDVLVEDVRGLADSLALARFGVVSHDVGAFVAQALAREYPERLLGLFFFNCPYPGIGKRWAEADHLREIWYQSFNQQPWAAALVGASRDACITYIGHFLNHWAHKPGSFDKDMKIWIDNFMKHGNLQGGFNWYIGMNEARLEVIRHGPPKLAKIDVPARVLWGESDKVLKIAWADCLGDYFADYSFAPASEAGHFVHYERPDLANQEIIRFFNGVTS